MRANAGWIVGLAMTLGACVTNYADEIDRDPVGGSDPSTGGNEEDDGGDDELTDSDGGSADEGDSNGPGDDDPDGDGGTPGDDSGEDSDGEQAAVFEQEIIPLFRTYCGCHLGATPSANLDLSASAAYDAMVGAPSTSTLLMVAPGSAADSYLVHKMQGTQSSVPGGWGTNMPPSGSGLPAEDLQALIDWVNDGAPYD